MRLREKVDKETREWLNGSGYPRWNKNWFPREKINQALEYFFSRVASGQSTGMVVEGSDIRRIYIKADGFIHGSFGEDADEL